MPELQPLNDDERDELISYLDGEADPKTARHVEAKLNRDPRVRAEADALRKTYDLLDYLPRPEPSPNFTARTLTRVSGAVRPGMVGTAKRRWRRWALGFSWAAAVVLVGVAGYAGAPLFYQPRPTAVEPPPDVDQQLVRDLRVIEHLRAYQQANDIHFLHELDRPELFGDERSGY